MKTRLFLAACLGAAIFASAGAAVPPAISHASVTVAPAQSGDWSPAAPMPSARFRHTATLLRSGDVLIAGGTVFSPGAQDSALRYQATTNNWSPAGTLAVARNAPTATLLRDGRVLLLGGTGASPPGLPLASGELYEPKTNNWSPSSPMSQPRAGHTATLLHDGRVLVIGGCSMGCDERPHSDWADTEVYDPSSDRWTRMSAMPVKREGHTATLLRDGRVLVVGGNASIWPAPAQLYDPTTDIWQDTPEILVNRVYHTATRLVDGRVLVVGGDMALCIVGPICPHVIGMQPEVYDPAQNAWMYLDGPAPRMHAATLLKSGSVLVTGGFDYWHREAVADADIFDPQSRTWTTVESMHTPRYWHSATLLKNGRVLVVGGLGVEVLVSAAEIFKPSASPRK